MNDDPESGACSSVSRRTLLLTGSAALATGAAAARGPAESSAGGGSVGAGISGARGADAAVLEGFEYRRIATSGATINVAMRGSGPPLLLLHGYPETHLMWHKVAPALAQDYTVVCADLRGYGDSSKPEGAPDHSNYSKRAMALDMIEVMAALGHRTFLIAAHDRGARVAYRLALDHPGVVRRLALLDIVSTKAVYEQVSMPLATAYFHWYFLIQPRPVPETLIGHDPGFWLNMVFDRLSGRGSAAFSDATVGAYLRAFGTPQGIHAACEDYRAGATVDLANDRADVSAGRKIACPTLILWGSQGVVGRIFQPLQTWRDLIATPAGSTVESGHFLAEENPQATLRELLAFLRG